QKPTWREVPREIRAEAERLLRSRVARAERVFGGYAPSAAFRDRKSTRLNSSHVSTSHAVFCLKKKTKCTVTASTSAPPRYPWPKAATDLSGRARCSSGPSPVPSPAAGPHAPVGARAAVHAAPT